MIEIFTQLEGMIITSIDTGCGRKVLLSCFNDAHPSFSKSISPPLGIFSLGIYFFRY